MTYPLILKINNAVLEDLGDPLFLTWIMAWDVHKFMELDFTGLFDANIFYPYKNTLAYSDSLIGEAIFALPVIAFLGNAILAYNLILLMGMALSGFGMYLLASYLTNNRFAAFCAGIIFAFFPWRFAQVVHVQLQYAQWIPLTFLCLHKFLDKGTYKYLFLSTTFFILQFLSGYYYSMYLTFFAGLLIGLESYRRRLSDKRFFYKIGLFFFTSAVFVLPFLFPYLEVKQVMGFRRSVEENIHYSADILSYVSVPTSNLFWGRMTKYFWTPGGGINLEGRLFIGLVALTLAIIGLAGC